MKYKLLAIDIDGTLLNQSKQITSAVKAAVKKASENGVIVTLATGRRHRDAQSIAAELGLQVPLIMYCGSIVFDTLTRQTLYHKVLEPDFIRKSVEIILKAGYQPGVLQSPLSGESIYFGPPENDDEFLKEYVTNPRRSDLVVRCHSYEELALVDKPLTVIATGPGHAAELLRKTIHRDFNCNLYSYPLWHQYLTDYHGFDFVQPGVGKGIALEHLAKHFSIELAQTVAIGDSSNDLDMIKAAGLGIAMGNASDEVKTQSAVVVASNEEDGVAGAIERYVLG